MSADWAIWITQDGAFIAIHVNDIYAGGTDKQLEIAFIQINKHIRMKDLRKLSRYLGLDIEYDEILGLFFVKQGQYARKILEEFVLINIYTAPTPMVEGEKWDDLDSELLPDLQKERYQSAIGMLLYLMYGTRPDISYPVIKLSQYSSKPRKIHWDGVKRIMYYLKGILDKGLILGNIEHAPKGLVAYFDSAHADNIDKWSTYGYLFILNGGLILWAT